MSVRMLPFLDVFKDASAGSIKTLQTDFLERGQIPVVDQGQGLIAGFVNDRSRICKAKPPVIVFGDHTRAVKYVDFEFAMGADGTKILVPRVESDTKYLYYALSAIEIPAAGYSRHYKFLKQKEIPLPPLAEQRRIAVILDAADALRAKRREALGQLDPLIQSVFIDMFGDPITNPMKWQVAELGSHTTKVGSGATPRGGGSSYRVDGVSLIRSMNVRDGEFLYTDLAHIDANQANKLSNVAVAVDDVLLNITGASVARVCRAPADVLPARVNQHVCIIRTAPRLEPRFLEQLLLTQTMKRTLLTIGEGGATRQAITKAQVLKLLIPLPPVALQRRFASLVRSGEENKAKQLAHLAELDTLFTSVQARAFRGEL